MYRRELLKSAAISGIAGSLLAPAIAGAAQGKASGGAASAALDRLQATLNDMEASFSEPEWRLRTPEDFAEARRVLLHALMHGLESWLEADPARPFFTSFINQHKKLLGDNPDARYFSAVISEDYSYRIRGNVAGAAYSSFTIELGTGTDGDGIGSTMNDSQFETDADGNFEIVISKEKQPGNWMPMPKGASSVTSRHYYESKVSINNQRLHHIPLDIENLDTVPPRSAPTDAQIAAGIDRVTTFV